MNPHTRKPESARAPLDAEERDLAERLARLGPHDGPPAALDAAILAAAHAAAAGRSSGQARRGWRRWPAALGIAATLALAIGLAWQLRPLPTHVPARDEGPSQVTAPAWIGERVAEPARKAAPAPSPPAPVAAQPMPPANLLSPPSPARTQARPTDSERRGDAAQRARKPAASAPSPAISREAISREAPVTAPQAFPIDTDALPPPPPAPPPPVIVDAPSPIDIPAPPAPPVPSSVREVTVFGSRMAAPASTRPPMADTRAETSTNAYSAAPAAQVADTAELTIADLPVAADTDLAPSIWLERIRQRRDAGQLDQARDSLRRFRAAHPDVVLPEDLRALLAAGTP